MITWLYGRSTCDAGQSLPSLSRRHEVTRLHLEPEALEDLHLGSGDDVLPVPEHLVVEPRDFKHEPFPGLCLLLAFALGLGRSSTPVVLAQWGGKTETLVRRQREKVLDSRSQEDVGVDQIA